VSGTSPNVLLPDRTSRRIALVSSYLGRWPYRRHDWFAALSTACRNLVPGGSTLLSVAGTTTAPYLERCAELFGHRIESKAVRGVARSDRDRLAIREADIIIVLSVRNRSRTGSLIEEFLANPPEHGPSLWFARTTSLVPSRTARLWESGGARPFDPRPRVQVTRPATAGPGRLASVRQTNSDDWLLHCTRECDGPWPGQPRDEYLDDLILGRDSADHSVQCTLRRILMERRLRAVSRPVRGGPPAVSFTACPLEELATRRIFRGHRGRWDFEPYGLAISRDWLTARGARPVVYRDHRDLVDGDLFEQPAVSRGPGNLDWTIEREWRHSGDVDLESLPADRGLVLVGHDSDIPAVAGLGPWPIVVIGRFRQDQPAIQ